MVIIGVLDDTVRPDVLDGVDIHLHPGRGEQLEIEVADGLFAQVVGQLDVRLPDRGCSKNQIHVIKAGSR